MTAELIAALLAAAGASAASPGPPSAPACERTVEANRRIVVAFYEEGLAGRRPRSAFERYMSADFVEHKADVPGGTREATANYLEALIASVPEPRWQILRTVAEGDLVFLHAKFSPAAGAEPYAIADLFRLKDCKIVEHWDVVAPPPKEQKNPNPRF